jgi:hypothetical protein
VVPGPQEVWGFLKGGRARLAIEERREPLEAATVSARRANAVGGSGWGGQGEPVIAEGIGAGWFVGGAAGLRMRTLASRIRVGRDSG